MSLNVKIVKENRERLDVRFRDFVLDAQGNPISNTSAFLTAVSIAQ